MLVEIYTVMSFDQINDCASVKLQNSTCNIMECHLYMLLCTSAGVARNLLFVHPFTDKKKKHQEKMKCFLWTAYSFRLTVAGKS